MDLIISKTPDVETILVNRLKDYLINGVKFAEMFANNEVKVTTDHPFVPLMQQQSNGESYDLKGFPCITIIDTNIVKAEQINVAPQTFRVSQDFLTDIDTFGRDKYLISKQTLAALKERLRLAVLGGVNYIRVEGYETYKRSNVALEIWATNSTIKNVLYDLVSLFLSASEWLFTLHQNYSIMIEENTITGEKSGIYNFDFGEILYGAMIRFSVAYQIAQYTSKDFIIGDSAVVEATASE